MPLSGGQLIIYYARAVLDGDAIVNVHLSLCGTLKSGLSRTRETVLEFRGDISSSLRVKMVL